MGRDQGEDRVVVGRRLRRPAMGQRKRHAGKLADHRRQQPRVIGERLHQRLPRGRLGEQRAEMEVPPGEVKNDGLAPLAAELENLDEARMIGQQAVEPRQQLDARRALFKIALQIVEIACAVRVDVISEPPEAVPVPTPAGDLVFLVDHAGDRLDVESAQPRLHPHVARRVAVCRQNPTIRIAVAEFARIRERGARRLYNAADTI